MTKLSLVEDNTNKLFWKIDFKEDHSPSFETYEWDPERFKNGRTTHIRLWCSFSFSKEDKSGYRRIQIRLLFFNINLVKDYHNKPKTSMKITITPT